MYTYWKWDKAISKECCNLIINNANWEKEIEGEIIKKTNNFNESVINKEIRNSNIVWEDSFSIAGCIAKRYIEAANISAGWKYSLDDIESVQISRYGFGGFYDWHTDGRVEQENPRKLSFVLLLSDPQDFNGGKLEFKNIDEQPVMEQGSIIVFPSSISHRVMPVTEGVRYSAVTWMRGPNFR